MLFEVWPSGWTSCFSPPPLQPCPIPAARRTHLKRFAFRADTRCWLARWKDSASGHPYQWRQYCVTHRERTSCSTTLLLFLLQTAAIALSFSSLLLSSFVLSLWERGVGLASGPHLQTALSPSESTLDYSLFPLLLSIFLLIFIGYWDRHFCSTRLLLWTLSPESCVSEVSDE